jgi:hypothetical protein
MTIFRRPALELKLPVGTQRLPRYQTR